MTKISIYNVDGNVAGNDRWIGTDAQNFNATKNFTPNGLADYFNHNQVIDSGNALRYTYQTLEPLEARRFGTISFITEIGPQVPFEEINTFLLSKYTLKYNIVSEYLQFLNGAKVVISKASDTNFFGLYKITNVNVYLPEPNFFNVDLSFIDGNGSMNEDQDYIISLVLDKYDQPVTNTSQLINDGADGVHPFITAQDIPPSASTLQEVTDNGNTTTNTISTGNITATDVSGGDAPFAGSFNSDDNSSLLAFVNLKTGGNSGVLRVTDYSAFREWTLPNQTGTIALTSDIPPYVTPTLDSVLAEGDTGTGKNITLTLEGDGITNYGGVVTLFDYTVGNIDNAIQLNPYAVTASDNTGQTTLGRYSISQGNGTNSTSLEWAAVTSTEVITIPNSTGTLALTSQIPSLTGYVPYTGATSDVDLGEKELTTGKLYLYDAVGGPTEKGSLHYADEALHFENSDGETLMYIEPGFMQLHKTGTIQSNFFTTLLTTNRDHYLPDASGTIALTSNIGSWGALNYPTWTSGTPFVKMTAAGTFALDTNTYLTGITSSDVTTALGYTPVTNARTLTINGTTYDLTANRSWTIPTYTSPLTTKGDIFVRNSSSDTRLPIGLDTQVLIADSTQSTGMKWGSNTAATPTGYYGAWQDNITQTAASSNVGYPMIFRTTDLSNGVTVVSNGTNLTRITFANTGIYNLQFSSQFQNSGNSQEDVTIWLRLNGVDVPGSSGLISVPARKAAGAGNEGHLISGWNYVLNIVGGQYYELVWSTSNSANVTMQYYAAGNPPPSAASVIMTVTQQSGIMAGTGLTAINSLTGAVQTLATGTAGTDFGISSTGTTHTFNIPTASSTNRGLLSSTDWSSFNSKVPSTRTVNSKVLSSDITLTTADIASSTNKNYITDAQVTIINNTSGVNTGDETNATIKSKLGAATASVDGYLTSTNFTTFNNKQAALVYSPYRYLNTTQSTVTGTLSETIVATATINANSFNANDVMKFLFQVVKGGTTNNVTMRVKINTSNTLTGATQIGLFTFLIANSFTLMQRNFVLSGGNIVGYPFATSVISDVISNTATYSSTSLNPANTFYVFFTIQLGITSDTATFLMANITN